VADPTIKIASCRSDKRCPECCLSLQERGGRLSLLPLPSCGCHCCPDCERLHMRALLTEAIRQRDAFAGAQKRDLNEATEAVHDLGAKLDCALRDVEMWKAKAIRVSAEADALERERDEARASRNTLILDLNCARAQATVVEEKAERAESEGKPLRLLVDSQTEQISRSAMDLYAAVQSEVAAEKRSEKAEEERDGAQAKLVEEREAMASISGELVQAQVKVAKERDSYRAALEECGELRSEARERAERAEALLLAREKHNGQ